MASAQSSQLREGDPVQVFSRSADQWVEGEIVKFVEDNFARVEYEIGEDWHGKMLHLQSEHLSIPSAVANSADEEHDSEFCAVWAQQAKKELDKTLTKKERDMAQKVLEQALSVAMNLAVTHGSEQAKCDLLAMADQNIDGAAQTIRDQGIEVQLPVFLKKAADIPGTTKDRQRRDPTWWAMTFRQWSTVVEECKARDLFIELKFKKPFDKFVSVYDINDYFVKPWTRGSGCGIALNMNPHGLEAEIMISHCWGEDVDECQRALRKAGIDENAAVWFCTFAQYQPEDGKGPSIKEQIQLAPFKRVIQSPIVQEVVAVHTTKADLYSRLWCVHELDEALVLRKTVRAAMSTEYEELLVEKHLSVIDAGGTLDDAREAAGVSVHTARASCGADDMQMLLKQIFSRGGGFARIDNHISEFRQRQVELAVHRMYNDDDERMQALVEEWACDKRLRPRGGYP